MTKQFSDECAVVAFYGGSISPKSVEPLYHHVVEWFDSLDCHPDKLGVKGKGFSGKVGSFSRNNARLKKSGFSEVEEFSLYSLVPGGEVPLWDWSVTTEISKQDSYCVIGARSSLASLSHGTLLDMACKAIEVLKPSYGIGFRREMRLGPSLYATGLAQGLDTWGEQRQEVSRINRWGDVGLEQRVYEQGILRDVYPWNFLTDSQLSRQLNGRSLKEWITQESRRGTLSDLTNSVSFWEVDESQVSPIRSELQSAGVIFDAT